MLKASALLLILGGAFAAHAQTTIATDLSASAIGNVSIASATPVGQSFSTGSTAYTLTSATLVMSNSAVAIPDGRVRSKGAGQSMGRTAGSNGRTARGMSNFVVTGCSGPCTQVGLFSDNGGPGPGTLLATSTTTELDSALSSSAQNVVFSFASYHLSAHTRYWIVPVSSTNSVAEWFITGDPTGTTLAGEYYEYVGFIFQDGPVDGAFLMAVSGTTSSLPTTPSPSTLILTVLGLLSVGAYFHWRKSPLNS